MNEIMPVIGDEELLIICFHPSLDDRGTLETAKDIAKAQSKADRKWMIDHIKEIIEEKSFNQEAALRRLLQALEEAIDG